MAVLYPGDVATQQTGTGLNIALREIHEALSRLATIISQSTSHIPRNAKSTQTVDTIDVHTMQYLISCFSKDSVAILCSSNGKRAVSPSPIPYPIVRLTGRAGFCSLRVALNFPLTGDIHAFN